MADIGLDVRGLPLESYYTSMPAAFLFGAFPHSIHDIYKKPLNGALRDHALRVTQRKGPAFPGHTSNKARVWANRDIREALRISRMHHEETVKGPAYELDDTTLLDYDQAVFVWEPTMDQHVQFSQFKRGMCGFHPSYMHSDDDVALPAYFLAFKDFTFVKRVHLKRGRE